MLKNILTGNVVISYVFNKISISNEREKNIPRRIRITLVSDVIHILTITFKKSGYGNIRELEHAIEKAIIICDNETLPAELFQLARRTGTPEAAASTLEEMEMQMIRKTFDKCSGNLSAVAAQLGITRQTLYNKMKKYGL